MIGLLQRVSQASVAVNGKTAGAIGRGILVFVGVERGDDEAKADRLLERLLGYRVFRRCRRKNEPERAGYRRRAACWCRNSRSPPIPTRVCARVLPPPPTPRPAAAYSNICSTQRVGTHAPVESGIFGADMQVTLTNDGPVTFWLES